MKKIIVIDSAIPFIEGRFNPEEVDLRILPTKEITTETVKDADALLGHTRTYVNEALLSGSNVRLVLTATIGMDHIDLAWCEANGIEVYNSPGCNAPGVAQYVWASLLAAGFDPKGSTVGVVGHGNVGTIVAEWGEKLGARVLLCDPPKALATGDNRYITLEEMLPQCDAVTLHTPLTKTGDHPTFHLMDAEHLKMMPTNSILVNAARGPVVDTAALKSELNECRLRGIIDTWEGEPKSIDKELLEMVEIGTPHIAGYSLEGKQRATRMALEKISEKLGVSVSLDGLAPDYQPKVSLDPAKILAGYNPYADMAILMSAPDNFDKLRSSYNFRKEYE